MILRKQRVIKVLYNYNNIKYYIVVKFSNCLPILLHFVYLYFIK